MPSQIELCVAPGFNHAPLQVPLTSNSPAADFKKLAVTCDAPWVSVSVDATDNQLELSFSTSELVVLTTATISAVLGGTTNYLFVHANLSPLSVVKLKDDPRRSRTYGIHQKGAGLGAIVIVDPILNTNIACITVGNQPTDIAISSDATEMLVMNCADKAISVIDLVSLKLKETLLLSAFDNWGVGSTSSHISYGRDNIIYYTDGAWAPVLRVWDRKTKTVLQSVYDAGGGQGGFGDFALTSGKSLLFTWMQYGWSAGLANSYVGRFAVGTNGTLMALDAGSSQYNSQFQRDPLESPVLISRDSQSIFIKGFELGPTSASLLKNTFPSTVFSITPGGEIAVTAQAIYDTVTSLKLADLPCQTPVQTITSDYARLVYFDPNTKAIKNMDLGPILAPFLSRRITPADESICLAPDQLQWASVPGHDRYRVYFGQSKAEVEAATTNSATFLGEVNQSMMAAPSPLAAGVTYYWRVDAVNEFGATPGVLMQFTVSPISSSIGKIVTRTVQGHANLRESFAINSSTPGLAWTASSDKPWVKFATNSGVTPAVVEVILDASALSNGVSLASVTISNDTKDCFSVPITLTVDPLCLTVLKSDPSSALVYAISEDTSLPQPCAYLLEIDSKTESIMRVTPVGSSATDLAIHNADGCIYVPNWRGGSLLVIDKNSMQKVKAHTMAPFGGVGYSDNDIYRVSAGAPGRLIYEAEDQWIDITIFNTRTGSNVTSAFVREGGGGFAPGGRYYYHGDNNSSGATIQKYDVTGDAFTKVAEIRVESWSYYGARTVVVSEDGGRIFWNGSALTTNLTEEWAMRDEVCSCTADGRYAFARNTIYDVATRKAILGMPVTTALSAFNSTSGKLVVPLGNKIGFYPFSFPPTLPAPSLFSKTVSATSVDLAWIDRSLETNFVLQYRLAGSSSWTDLARIPQNTTNYKASGLTAETSYEFRIKADGNGISSDWSATVQVTTPGAVPNTPSLNLVTATANYATIFWSDAGNETGYLLERSTGSSTNWIPLTALAADTLSYVDTNVTRQLSYFYRIMATNAFGSSSYSSYRGVAIPVPPPPAAPYLQSVVSLNRSSIRVAWNEVADAAQYRIERRTDDPLGWTVIAIVPSNTVYYIDTNLTAFVQYVYRVQAVNGAGVSAYSGVGSAIANDTACVWQDSFDPQNPLMWAEICGGWVTNGGAGFRTNNALYFAGAGTRYATTIPLDVSSGGTLEYWIRAGNELVDTNGMWNNSEAGEGILVEYSFDGEDWVAFQTINSAYPALTNWTSVQVSIPSAAFSKSTQFRWRQPLNSGPQFDCWALDDAQIRAASPAAPQSVPFVVANANSSASIAVYWIGVSGATSYTVQRNAGAGWTNIATVSCMTPYYVDSGLSPGVAHSYRIVAQNARGTAAPSSVATEFTWSQLEEWTAENYGFPDGLGVDQLLECGSDGSSPLLRFAFNLTGTEALHVLQPGGTSGLPNLKAGANGISIEFIQRKAALKPGVAYCIEYSTDLSNWIPVTEPVTTVSLSSEWECVKFQHPTATTNATRFYRVAVRKQ